MKIAVVDDERVYLEQIENYVERMKKDYYRFDCDTFSSGKEFLDFYNKNNIYDVVILDIELGDVSGVEIGKILRKNSKSIVIFFLTSHSKYMYDCFDPMPMKFFNKPIPYDFFKKWMLKAHEYIAERKNYIWVTENREKLRLKYEDIVYMEYRERKLWIYTTEGCHSINVSIPQMLNELNEQLFVRTHKSFVVNLDFVYIIDKDNDVLTLRKNYGKIPISRTYKSILINKYINNEERDMD